MIISNQTPINGCNGDPVREERKFIERIATAAIRRFHLRAVHLKGLLLLEVFTVSLFLK